MTANPPKVWKLSHPDGVVETFVHDAQDLDALARQLPQGYYTTFRTYDGGKRALGLKAHLERLYQPAAQNNIIPAVSSPGLRKQLAMLLHACPNEARVRLVLAQNGELFIALTHLIPLARKIYQKGVHVVTSEMQRESPRIKSTRFIAASESTRARLAQSAVFEALLVRRGAILEGLTSNFFYFKEDELGTAQKHILLGVTRRTVLQAARERGIRIAYRPLKREQVSALSEAFLTSSSRGIVPITQIDDTTVGEGMPGEVAKLLGAAYQDFVMRQAEMI